MLASALVPFLTGCTGADDPKLADAPEFKGTPETAAQKIPGRKEAYGASKKYQDAMNK